MNLLAIPSSCGPYSGDPESTQFLPSPGEQKETESDTDTPIPVCHSPGLEGGETQGWKNLKRGVHFGYKEASISGWDFEIRLRIF